LNSIEKNKHIELDKIKLPNQSTLVLTLYTGLVIFS